jgi:PAP2 superfamily
MPNLMWTWQQAVTIAAVLAAGWLVLLGIGRAPKTQPFLREAALIIGLYAFWQYAGSLSGAGTYAAVGRGQSIWNTERSAHLLSEHTVQGWILPHPLIVQAANLYYDTMHFTVMICFLIWLFVRHRDAYPRWRTTLALLTASCLLIQLIPVAPPRMVPGTGMVDTALRYGQSVYGSVGGFDPDQLSAMPSVHVAWAVLVACCVVTVSRSRWRFLAIAHAVITVLVVVGTGNHYWSDGIIAVCLLLLALGAQGIGRSASARFRGARKNVEGAIDAPAAGLVDAARTSG